MPFREEDLWNGYPEETNAPYGVAKKALLVMCQAYRQQYGLNAIYLLPVNLYGPRDNFDLETSHVIPALIRKCIEAVRPRRRADRLLGRRLADPRVPLRRGCGRGHRAGDRAIRRAEPVNLGSGREITIRDLATLIARLTGFTGRIEWDTTKPNGQPRRCLDVTRARERFGFTAATDFETGLKRTIEWYSREMRTET